jgi:hypothetical protein
MGKTQSKPFVAGERQGNGMGTAWDRHGMCESAFMFFAEFRKFYSFFYNKIVKQYWHIIGDY